ncbi:MAG: NADH:ubiquinone reductase (Na(+)-transporting) subunit B [Flammeovirgaceae bacterium]
MKFLHKILEKQRPLFSKGGKFEKFYYLFEAGETFLFTPDTVTSTRGVQVRDAIDLKRMMMTVVLALVPCLIYGIWNTGYQFHVATGAAPELMDQILIGLRFVLPIVLVSYAAGGLIEAIFAVWRKHPINEGFLVTGMLIPLVVPPTIPLWQVALAAIFAVLIAKEVFGGTGMNILNVALTARAFLYFGYPGEISGSKVWTYVGEKEVMADGTEIFKHPFTGETLSMVDGFTGETILAMAAEASKGGMKVVDKLDAASSALAAGYWDTMNMFMGSIPGSIGETSVLMCLIGAAILIFTGVGSWKIIVSVFAGTYGTGLLLNGLNAWLGVNEYMAMAPEIHVFAGGLAFAAVFMATDPVTATQTETGKWIYGFLIGFLTVIIRVANPAFPEGAMLAVLLMNVFAPLIDFYVVKANKKRRLQRATV